MKNIPPWRMVWSLRVASLNKVCPALFLCKGMAKMWGVNTKNDESGSDIKFGGNPKLFWVHKKDQRS